LSLTKNMNRREVLGPVGYIIGTRTYRPIMEMGQSNLIGTLRRLPLFTT